MIPTQRVLSIAWAESSRVAETLARRLGAEFVLLPCPRLLPLRRISHYQRLRRKTYDLLNLKRPDVVLVQSPPIHAVSVVADYARRTGAAFVIDAHSGALLGRGVLQKLYQRRLSKLGQKALVTLIHNFDLETSAAELRLNYLVLEMAVPEPSTRECKPLSHPAVAVICGYGRDEPMTALLKAAASLTDVNFYLTGKSPVLLRRPGNVTGTGFLKEDDYWQVLNGADVVMALTTRDATVLSGAYEGLGAGKPLVLSRTETLAQAFHKGAVLVENSAESIAEGVSFALRHSADLACKGQELRAQKDRDWQRQFQALQRLIGESLASRL